MVEDEDQQTRQYLLARFWEAALGFWHTGGGRPAWLLTLTVITIALVNLGLQYRLNVWHRAELEAFHTRKLVLEYHPEGARLVRDEPLPRTFRRSARLLSRLRARDKSAKAPNAARGTG